MTLPVLEGELEPPVCPVQGVHHPPPVPVVAVPGPVVKLVSLDRVVNNRSEIDRCLYDISKGAFRP